MIAFLKEWFKPSIVYPDREILAEYLMTLENILEGLYDDPQTVRYIFRKYIPRYIMKLTFHQHTQPLIAFLNKIRYTQEGIKTVHEEVERIKLILEEMP